MMVLNNEFDNVFIKRVFLEKTETKLFIRIKKAKLETYWYSKLIGEKFYITNKDIEFNNLILHNRSSHFISKEDCELI